MKYASHFSTKKTPQTEKIPGKKQVQNNAGGFVFSVDNWTKLDRFLILGSEGGSYYATEKALTIENAQNVLACAKEDGKRTVARIVEISDSGRAPKNDPAIFALAICAGEKIPDALLAISKVCRIGTHLFQFVEAVEKFRGHGRALNRALKQWYTDKEPKDVAFQCAKYQQRNGWSHRDILRLCKPKVEGVMSTIFGWVVGKTKPENMMGVDSLQMIVAFEKAKVSTDKKEICRLITDFNLPRECIPTQFLTEACVWEALLEKMPMTAMVRNLATMTRVGLLKPMSNAVSKVINELTNEDRIKKSRLHPIALLMALKTYAQGRGEKGQNTWVPVPQIIDALDDGFYKAFVNVEPTNKRWMLGVDISGSMSSPCVSGLSCCEGATAMALVIAHKEANYNIMGFAHEFRPLAITKRSRLDDALTCTRNQNFGATDCSLPMIYAMENKINVDAFMVLTDNETFHGAIHPTQALQEYRQKMGIPAKMIVCGMTSANFTIADPDDAGSMDVIGWDSNIPSLVADFVRD